MRFQISPFSRSDMFVRMTNMEEGGICSMEADEAEELRDALDKDLRRIRRLVEGARIVVTQRSDDFHACVEGHKDQWESALTMEGAIGKLRASFPKLRNAAILFKA